MEMFRHLQARGAYGEEMQFCVKASETIPTDAYFLHLVLLTTKTLPLLTWITRSLSELSCIVANVSLEALTRFDNNKNQEFFLSHWPAGAHCFHLLPRELSVLRKENGELKKFLAIVKVNKIDFPYYYFLFYFAHLSSWLNRIVIQWQVIINSVCKINIL